MTTRRQLELEAEAMMAMQEQGQGYSEVPEWGQQNPRLYGVAGAAKETLMPLVEMAALVGGGMAGTASGGRELRASAVTGMIVRFWRRNVRSVGPRPLASARSGPPSGLRPSSFVSA